jgi:formiminotetrahydrofolate cyclodeaminase
MESEMVAELMADKKGMADMQNEMKKIMGNVKDTEVAETEEDEGSVEDNEASVDSDMKIAA